MQFFDPFNMFPFFGFFWIFGVAVSLIVFIIVISVFLKICRAASKTIPSTFSIRPPDFVLPSRRDSSSTQTSGPDIRMVRLPTRCPTCGAALSEEGIDWVGPLEAKCNYCGGTVRAVLDKL